MKNILIMLLCLFGIFFSTSMVYAVDRCIMCGMDSQKSETKFVVQVLKGTKKIPAGSYALCSLHCFVLIQSNVGRDKIGSIMARDYNTVTDDYDSGEMIDARKGYYLIEGKLLPKGSMYPFMLIFSTEKTAKIYQKIYGGRILNWKEVLHYTKP